MLRESTWTVKKELCDRIEKDGVLANAEFMDRTSVETSEVSAFARVYANFLHQKMKAINHLGFDVDAESSEEPSRMYSMSPHQLLENLPVLQDILRRLVETQPTGSSGDEEMVQVALIMTVRESFKLYRAVYGGMSELLNRFTELGPSEASQGSEIFRRGVKQTESLQHYYDTVSKLESLSRFQFPKLEQYPPEDIKALDDYVKGLQTNSMPQKTPPFLRYRSKRQQKEEVYKDKLQTGDAVVGDTGNGNAPTLLRAEKDMHGAEETYIQHEHDQENDKDHENLGLEELLNDSTKAQSPPDDPFESAGFDGASADGQANGAQNEQRVSVGSSPMSQPSKREQQQQQQQQQDPFSGLI